jgi:hypothetical protein
VDERRHAGDEPSPAGAGTQARGLPGRGDDLRHTAISAVPTAAALSLPLWALLGLVARWLLG